MKTTKKVIASSFLLIGGLFLLGQQPVSAEVNETTYNVKAGDNLYRIALNHNVSLDKFVADNGITKKTIIKPGDKLTIAQSTPIAAATSTSVYGAELTPWQYDTLLAVVQQESGGTEYESTLAVMSVILNRADNGNYGGKSVWGVVTAPHQFEAYGANHYIRHLGKITPITKKAVSDALSGKRNMDYLNFWTDSYYHSSGRYDAEAANMNGNMFFNM